MMAMVKAVLMQRGSKHMLTERATCFGKGYLLCFRQARSLSGDFIKVTVLNLRPDRFPNDVILVETAY